MLRKIYNFCLFGWLEDSATEEFKAYLNKKQELHLEQGCILWGHRVVVPEVLHNKLLLELHIGHLGGNKCLILHLVAAS